VYPVSSLVIGEQLFATSTTAQTSKVSRGPQLVQASTISASASVIVPLTTAFSRYILDLEDVKLADAENLEMTVSVDGGSVYLSAGYTVHGTERVGSLIGWTDAATAMFTLHDDTNELGAGAGELPYRGTYEFTPGDGTVGFRIHGNASYHDGSGTFTALWLHGYNDNSVVRATHIKIVGETSNMTSGLIRVWGIV
ncbi:MAG: hypothetical protein V3S01_13275, partial [Dehalococcoidia bacterium]